jgi:hypothetical protein
VSEESRRSDAWYINPPFTPVRCITPVGPVRVTFPTGHDDRLVDLVLQLDLVLRPSG